MASGGQRSLPWRYRLRELALTTTVVGLLSAVGCFAWLTRQPDHAVFERLAGMPVIGAVVDELRRPYLLPRGGADTGGTMDAQRRSPTSSRPATAAAEADPVSPADGDSEWIGIGARLYREPSRSSRLRSTTTRLSQYQVSERRGEWLRIELPDGTSAWVDRAEERDSTPPLGSEPLPPGPLHARPVKPERLEAAKRHLSSPRQLRLAAYPTWTDLPVGSSDQRLLDAAAQALLPLEDTYQRLYGVRPVGEPRETIVLYAATASYRALQGETEGIAGTLSAGHTTGGLVALAVGDREQWEVLSTLVHEVAHLLNRRAIGPGLPPWLAEGLSDHLALLGRTEDPELDGRWRAVSSEKIEYRGPLASLRLLAESAEQGTLLSLERLTATRTSFATARDAPLLYAQSAFWIDSLLEDTRTQQEFKRFLREVADGGPATGEALRRRLGNSWELLDLTFAQWLVARHQRAVAAGW